MTDDQPERQQTTIEEIAKIIDPEAFGLPAWQPSDGSDYLTDRDEARDKAAAIMEIVNHG